MDLAYRQSTLLNADVVGYSARMARDEPGTTRALIDGMGRVIRAVVNNAGQVIDTPGDNLLAEFATEGDAVRCALQVQLEEAQRGADAPEGVRLAFRIGVHSGTMIEFDGRRYGHAVNLTARLQSAAAAGGVLISAETAARLAPPVARNSLAAPRRLQLKNIPTPVYAFEGLGL